jgi:hypothetical protein
MNTLKAFVLLLAAADNAYALQLHVQTQSREFSCANQGSSTILGSVVEAAALRFVLDQCLPTQDCQRVVPATISLSAPDFAGFQTYLKMGGFVRVQFDVHVADNVCEERIAITSVGNWLGARNPSGDGDRFYFAAATNTTASVVDGPLIIRRCPDGRRVLGMSNKAGGRAHDAALGQSTWQVSDRETRIVRVVTAGSCGADRMWKYWVARKD